MHKFKLVFFEGCPNVGKARKLLTEAGIDSYVEVRQEDLEPHDPLKRVSSPAILNGDEIVIGEKCAQDSGACTFPFGSDRDAINLLKAVARGGKAGPSTGLMAGAGGGLGLLALTGACSSGCSLLVAPLAAFLGSVGLGAVASWVPLLRYPLLALSIALGALAVMRMYRMRLVRRAAIAAFAVVGLASAAFYASSPPERRGGTAQYLRTLSQETQTVVREGIYRTWIRLGRAPSLEEVRAAMGEDRGEMADRAIAELKASGFSDMFEPGTEIIRWFWPLSSRDHGIRVTLEGAKTVLARCAVDALGMSEMFGKKATIEIRTPLFGKRIEFVMNSASLQRSDPSVVVSRGDGCDDLLFFSSAEEFKQYKEKTGRNLKMMSLPEAVNWGLASFGSIFKG